MTLLTKQEIEALLDGTTPGPWELDGVRPHTAHVWPVNGSDDPITGEIDIDNAHLIAAAPDLARTALDALARLEDAEAAQALVVERAADEAAGEVAAHGEAHLAPFVRRRIRAIAPASGVEALAALRAEIKELNAECERHCDAAQQADGLRYNAEAEAADLRARLAAAEGRVGVLTEALNMARDPGRQPDYCYDEEWEYTMGWDQWAELVEYHDLTEPVPVYTLYKGPTKWAVNVPNSWDEDGTPDGWDVEIFDSETAARAALATVTPPADTGEGRT